MKIGLRLVIMISIFNIIGIGLLAGFTMSISQKEISRLAEEQGKSLAEKGVEEIKNWFGTYVDTARTIADIMEGYKDIPAEERREQFNFMLKQTLIAHPEVTLVYTNWAQNALDGMDTDFANTPGTDETGRYATNWSASNGHDVRMWPIDGFPFDLVMQATSGQEFVFEPSEHFVGDKNWLVTNLCIPIKDNNQMVGSTGIVFELSTIQTIADT
ncbi:MAG: cache domain-containing protein, partial [Treponema sp.]|nr:cache domain-containing protein [Treponema sp.]